MATNHQFVARYRKEVTKLLSAWTALRGLRMEWDAVKQTEINDNDFTHSDITQTEFRAGVTAAEQINAMFGGTPEAAALWKLFSE